MMTQDDPQKRESVSFRLFQMNLCKLSFSSIPIRSRTGEQIVFVSVPVIYVFHERSILW